MTLNAFSLRLIGRRYKFRIPSWAVVLSVMMIVNVLGYQLLFNISSPPLSLKFKGILDATNQSQRTSRATTKLNVRTTMPENPGIRSVSRNKSSSSLRKPSPSTSLSHRTPSSSIIPPSLQVMRQWNSLVAKATSNTRRLPWQQLASARGEENCGDTQIAQTWLRSSERLLMRWFRPKLTGRNLCSLLNSTYAVAAALTSYNVTFFMYGGTLIGSWRHHGFVPWDDDVDFAIDHSQSQIAYRALMDLKPRFVLNVKQKIRWKLNGEKDQSIPDVTWRYPFVDINFFHQNDTHVWDHDAKHYKEYTFPRDWIFPLIMRPFHGYVMLPAPRQTEKYLRLTYQLDECSTANYNHQKEIVEAEYNKKTVSCDRLRPFLPFVYREPLNEKPGCNETLVQEGRELGFYESLNYMC